MGPRCVTVSFLFGLVTIEDRPHPFLRTTVGGVVTGGGLGRSPGGSPDWPRGSGGGELAGQWNGRSGPVPHPTPAAGSVPPTRSSPGGAGAGGRDRSRRRTGRHW